MKKLLKTLRNTIYILLTAVFVVCILTPFVYWTINPELTQMQVFIKFWWVMLIGIAAAIFGAIPILNNR